MKLLSAREWARRGFRIRTGARSEYRGAGGVALFTNYQVVPWDYTPAHFVPRQDVISVNGALYARI